MEDLVASLKQVFGIEKKRVSELKHALEVMNYDSDGMSQDDDEDSGLGLSDDSDDVQDSLNARLD